MKKISKDFDLNHWLAVYKRVQELGEPVRNHHKLKDPVKLPEETLQFLKTEIKEMTDNMRIYMDRTGMRMPSPRWIFDINDTRTWKSHEDFIYQDRCA